MPLNKASQPISAARSAAAVSVVKKGLPVPAAKITTRPFSMCRTRAAADIGLGDRRHRDRRQDAGVDADLLERVLQRQRVHHRRQHAHIIGAGPVEALGGAGQAAEDVAAADDEAELMPLPWRRAISSASRATASGSMPNWPSPIRASPDSFRRMRLKRGRGIGLGGPFGSGVSGRRAP